MTLDEAIHNQQLHLDGNSQLHDTKLRQSMHLGIEAMKRFKRLREVIRVPYTDLLPGEDPQ